MANRSGFTLVEMLVVVGIVALLIALILPSLELARGGARLVQCTSNMRQLGLGLRMYADDNNGFYPPNTTTPAPGLNWFDSDRVQHYLGIAAPTDGAQLVIPPVFLCPDDPYGQRSYSMNIWASATIDKMVANTPGLHEELWLRNRKHQGLILLSESWAWSWTTLPIIGKYGATTTAGHMFGALGGVINYPSTEFGPWLTFNCDLAYERHRAPPSLARSILPIGRVNICFDDNHVGVYSNQDLVNAATGQTTGAAAWSPLDFVRN